MTKQVIEAKDKESLYAPFEELKEIYFSENRYSDFVEFLSSLSAQKKTINSFTGYYTALSRYRQLKYLEESQEWEEYFSRGNAYREEITISLKGAIENTAVKEPLNIYSRLILWRFHEDQQDGSSEGALEELLSSLEEYSREAKDLSPIKSTADQLLAYGKKAEAKRIFRVYVDKLITPQTKEEGLLDSASLFYKEGNLDLAEEVYDSYIERALGTGKDEKGKIIAVLTDIATAFSYKEKGKYDLNYCEKIFKRIEELGGNEAFSDELLYIRAFSLEKEKDYAKAMFYYSDLAGRFPGSLHSGEANYKAGIFHTYVSRDAKQGRAYFEKLVDLNQESATPQAISSLYQLGLLSQWEGDLEKAKNYYDKLQSQAKQGFGETVKLARNRLNEIEEGKPLEYNLKSFLDASLKEENADFNMQRLNLKASSYNPKQNEAIGVSSEAYTTQSGCMQVELQYLWSGDLGSASGTAQQAFETFYSDTGTKVVNLVAVSPSGIVDRSLDIIDVR